MEMWFSGAHLEVSPVSRLVYTEVMTDPEGNPMPASAMGMEGDKPFVTEVTVELEDLGGKTKVTMTHAGVPAGSPGEFGWRQAFAPLVTSIGSHDQVSLMQRGRPKGRPFALPCPLRVVGLIF